MSGQAFEGAMAALWGLLADSRGNSRTLAEVCEEAGAALRRGWDSAAPVADDGAPYWVEPAEPPRDNPADFERVSPDPGSGYATIATLRARVAELVAELEAQIEGLRFEPRAVSEDCLTGDGTTYKLNPALHRGQIYIRIRQGSCDLDAVIRRADLLSALGIRGDL
jgi:hypothetical protein